MYVGQIPEAWNTAKLSAVVSSIPNYSAEMWSGSEEGSYLRLIDLCIPDL